MLTKKDYLEGLQVQNACNLSGVVHTLSPVVSKVWDEAHELKKGTDYVNTHPLVIVYLDKINSLARIQGDAGSIVNEAFAFVEKQAETSLLEV